MSDDLNLRIAQQLDADPQTDDPDAIAQTLRAVRGALVETQSELNQTRETAFDPSTSIVAASRAREHVDNLEFRLERLLVASDRLTARHQDATSREAAKAREAHKYEVSQQRDAFVTRLRDEYPQLATSLVDLLSEMTALDAECTRIGVPTVEMLARGWDARPNGGQVFPLAVAVQLPSLQAGAPALWPPAQTHRPVGMTAAMLASAHLTGEHMRNVGARVAEAKAFEQTASRRKLG